jgi:rod shape-determining protein MreC
MRNLLNFLVRYNNLIAFIILESIAFYLLTTGNNYHNSRMVKGMEGLTRGIEEKITITRRYLNLNRINSELATENSNLRNRIARLKNSVQSGITKVNDTIFDQQYTYTSGQIINNSVNKQKNYFTIDKGSLQGIRVDMAVTDGDYVAGVIVGSSNNFSVAISLLNLDFRLSARIKSNGYFGSLSWDGRNYREASLNEIPQNVKINVGDTVETTGYSAIFPEGTLIGVVSNMKPSGSDFYRISVELFTDFKKLSYVNIIGNLQKTEQSELENRFQ